MGFQNQFSAFGVFHLFVQKYKNTGYVLNIKFIVDRSHKDLIGGLFVYPTYPWHKITERIESHPQRDGTNRLLWTSLVMTHSGTMYMYLGVTGSGVTVYPKKYAHGFVVLCFVVVMQSFIMNSHEVFIHIHQGCFAGTGAIGRLPQCQWSKLDGYGKICQCITTTKHSKAKTVCIFLGIYCIVKDSLITRLWVGVHKDLVSDSLDTDRTDIRGLGSVITKVVEEIPALLCFVMV